MTEELYKHPDRFRQDQNDDKWWNKDKYNPEVIETVYWDKSKETRDLSKKSRYENTHGSTSGYEILKDGSTLKRIVGNQYEYYKKGVTTTYDGNVDTKVGGHSRMNVSGGMHTEVAGDRSDFTAKSSASYVGKNFNMQVKESMSMGAGKSLVITSTGGNGKAKTRISLADDGKIHISSDSGDITLESKSLALKGEKVSIAAGELNLGYDSIKMSNAPAGVTTRQAENSFHQGIKTAEVPATKMST